MLHRLVSWIWGEKKRSRLESRGVKCGRMERDRRGEGIRVNLADTSYLSPSYVPAKDNKGPPCEYVFQTDA